jgi:hypothetical protein
MYKLKSKKLYKSNKNKKKNKRTKKNLKYKKNKKLSKNSIKKKYIMKGGNYNSEEIRFLRKILTSYQFTEDEINYRTNIFNQISQNFPFLQLISQIGVYDDEEDSYENLTQEEIEQGREDVERILDDYINIYIPKYEGETDSEKSSNEPGFN